ncbi:MAG TPA: ATPase, T2SS/T4P/T4SS family [Acidobacteriota bacterium]
MMSPQRQPSEANSAGTKIDVGISARIDPEMLSDFPIEIAREFRVLPLHKNGDSLILATDIQLRAEQLDELHRRLGYPFHVVRCDIAGFAATLDALSEKSPSSRKVEKMNRPPDRQKFEAKTFARILMDRGLVRTEELPHSLIDTLREHGIALAPATFIDRRVMDLMPETVARRYKILPIGRVENNFLVATHSNQNAAGLAEVRGITGLSPVPLYFEMDVIEASIEKCYRRRQQLALQRMLVAKELISREQLHACLKIQAGTNDSLSELLVKQGYVTEDAIYACLSETLGYEYRRFKTADIDLEASHLVSRKFAEVHCALPLALDRKNRVLEVAVTDPTDLKVMDILKAVASGHGYRLKTVLASPSSVRQGIDYTYNFRGATEETEELETVATTTEDTSRPELIDEDMPAIRRIANKVLYMAVMEGASDVHIENLESRVRVRFRIDGILHERNSPINKDNIRKITSLLKIDAGLDITEHRRAQDGVFKKKIDRNRFLDFRINAHATEFGEDAVIRILDASKNLLSLDKLGLPPQMLKMYVKLVENPEGLILFTGPTGSGKSTTLYSTLNHLNSGEKKIVTAEDPVEYYLDGICQYQVNEPIGNTFAEQARRFLRKDPDIILIGEIRDEDTAEACFRAALTGHLVFSTLHTANSLGVVQRLRDLGVEPSSLGEALLAVIAQRLARRNCLHCRKPYHPDPGLMSDFYTDELPVKAAYQRGTGCSHCNGTGYKGRIGLYEFWYITDEARMAISSGGREGQIPEIAYRTGLMPLMEDGMRKVHDGVTTLEELRRVVPLEEIRRFANFKM